MAAASLALSIVALLVAAAGLGWTVFEWHRSGARLKVTCTSMVLFGNPIQPEQQWFVSITVTNTGRTATTVTSVGFDVPGYSGVLVLSDPAAGPNPIPKRLEPGDSFDYPVEPEALIRNVLKLEGDPRTVKPYANCGHGRFVGKGLEKTARGVIASRIPKDQNSSS